ncbi:VOC family protein [Microtetraspora fusca]|uniref:VOC family protein n=1 Tax=Microtetraspora fusca TaxID=1997 RepID=A0ABW6VBC8_MICFU|nr:VOC family protein [Microtetraspora fusca]
MIKGAHWLLYSHDPDADRAFLRDVLGLRNVDAGGGWLIFRLPPAELGVHPTRDRPMFDLYLMCDRIADTVRELTAKGVTFTREVGDEGYGLVTGFRLPGGAEIGLYEPRHPTAI